MQTEKHIPPIPHQPIFYIEDLVKIFSTPNRSISAQTIQRWIKQGKLKGQKPLGVWFVRQLDLLEFLGYEVDRKIVINSNPDLAEALQNAEKF